MQYCEQMSIYVSCIGEGVRVILTSQKELGSISPDFLKGTEVLVQFHKDLVVHSHERNSVLCFLLSKATYSSISLLIFSCVTEWAVSFKELIHWVKDIFSFIITFQAAEARQSLKCLASLLLKLLQKRTNCLQTRTVLRHWIFQEVWGYSGQVYMVVELEPNIIPFVLCEHTRIWQYLWTETWKPK